MSATENVALHRKGHEAFSRNDMDTLTELIAEDTLWHSAGTSPLSGDYTSRDAVFAFFGKLAELSEGTLQIHDDDFLGSETRSVSLLRMTATRGDKKLDADCCEVVRWENGQVAEDWFFAFDQRTFDEFWS